MFQYFWPRGRQVLQQPCPLRSSPESKGWWYKHWMTDGHWWTMKLKAPVHSVDSRPRPYMWYSRRLHFANGQGCRSHKSRILKGCPGSVWSCNTGKPTKPLQEKYANMFKSIIADVVSVSFQFQCPGCPAALPKHLWKLKLQEVQDHPKLAVRLVGPSYPSDRCWFHSRKIENKHVRYHSRKISLSVFPLLQTLGQWRPWLDERVSAQFDGNV